MTGLLEIKGVTRRFGGLVALQEVSLSVPQGQALAIIGPNGAGKSTLINLLSGVDRPSEGRIRLAGDDITAAPAHRRARLGIARTYQNGRLFPRLSVLENVETGATAPGDLNPFAVLGGAEDARRERAMTALERVGLAARAGDAPLSLPYGAQRLVEIARALASDPKLLLLDEPAAGLVAAEVDALLALLAGLVADGLTIILIEHNMGLVMRYAQRIAVLNFGRLIAEGAPAEIRENPQVIEAYLGASKTKPGIAEPVDA